MGKFKEFSINFDSNEGLYLPGQYVRGQVKLDLEYEVKARSLVLIVYGKAYNNWKCREHSKKYYDSMSRTWKTKAEIYPVELDETYIDRKFVLWSSSRDEESISSGVNNFNFDFIIPSNCPPSFEGKYGSVRYYCKAELERPSKSEKKATASFTVLSNLDPNSTLDASRPVSMEKSSNLGLFFRQGSLFLKATLNKKGFVPGETANITLNIHNGTSKEVYAAEIKMKEKSWYLGACRHKSGHEYTKEDSKTVIALQKELKVPSKQQRSCQFSFKIPQIAPIINNCNILKAKHDIEIKIEADGRLKNSLKLHLPIIIGGRLSQQRQNMHLTIPIVPNNNLSPNTGLRSPRKCSSSLALNSYSSTEKIASDALEYTTGSTTDLYLRPNSCDGSEGSRSAESVENGRCSEENLLSPSIASVKRLSIKKRQATISTPNLFDNDSFHIHHMINVKRE